MRSRFASLVVVGALAVGFGRAASAEVTIVATLPDLAAIAFEVGGAHVSVRSIADPRQDPHYVDPRPNFIVLLNRADLVIANGLELEVGWLPPVLTQARNPSINPGRPGFLDVSAHVDLLGAPQERVSREMGDVHLGGNPHYTFSPLRAAGVAAAIRDRLSELDPSNAEAYAANAVAFVAELETFAEAQRQRFALLPEPRRQVVPYHESMIYLTSWLDLDAIAHIEPVPGTPPSPGHVAQVLRTMRSTGARVVIQEEYYPTTASRNLAQLADGELVVLAGGTRFDEGERYIDHLGEIADAIYLALSESH